MLEYWQRSSLHMNKIHSDFNDLQDEQQLLPHVGNLAGRKP